MRRKRWKHRASKYQQRAAFNAFADSIMAAPDAIVVVKAHGLSVASVAPFRPGSSPLRLVDSD